MSDSRSANLQDGCDPHSFDAIFLDMGGVFIRDDAVDAHYLWGIYSALKRKQPGLTPAEFFAHRERTLAAGDSDWLGTLARTILSPSEMTDAVAESWATVLSNWSDLAVPIEDACAMIRKLAASTRLGLIANQPTKALQTLSQLGLSEYFEVVAIDDILGYSKPDLRLFEWALAKARVAPANVLMVGDRIDNDIIPAIQLGMQTAWIRNIPSPLRVKGVPKIWEGFYFASLRRLGMHNQHLFSQTMAQTKPNYRASSLANLFSQAVQPMLPMEQ
jgi:HAD superfamily hydrolase (TIGR01549 family)